MCAEPKPRRGGGACRASEGRWAATLQGQTIQAGARKGERGRLGLLRHWAAMGLCSLGLA